MDNLISETNTRLQEIIDNLTTIKTEYENKLRRSSREIDVELDKVNKYKEDFFVSKQKIEKMNSDIEGFEADYQNLVDRFKDDELANILIAANKEISAKIDERKRKIAKDKLAMNELIEKAELSKNKLVKITAEKKALELCLAKILDAYEFYSRALTQVIEYTQENTSDLSKCFFENNNEMKSSFSRTIREITSDTKDFDKAVKDEDKLMDEEDPNEDDALLEEENIESVEVINEDLVDEDAPFHEKLDMSEEDTQEKDEVVPNKVTEIKVTDKKEKTEDKKTSKKETVIEDVDLDKMNVFDDSIES
ncbi:MAG: hypothetical protein OSJ65_04695 [Bacilli bacterium]|nr:hypothetical protein [Bacilli bacterium]